MTGFTEATLRRLWPRADPDLVAGIAAAQPRVYAKWNITSDLIVAHMMAQFSHECGAGEEMVENTNYSAARAAEVWPLRGSNDRYAYRHFADANDCYRKCKSSPGDPDFHRKLINLVYGDRNGNRVGTDDGWNFIGRGLPQLTGRENYAKSEKDTGIAVLENPALASAPETALEIGVADFIACGCLPYAQRDDIDNVTLKLNGGHIGLAERKDWLARWKAAMASQGAHQADVRGPEWVQHALNVVGQGPLVEDGQLGPKSRQAIARYQKAEGLTPDGIAGPLTIATLEEAMNQRNAT